MDKVHTCIPVSRQKRTKNHTLRGGIHLYGLYRGVPTGIPALNKIFERFLSRQMYEFYNGLLSDVISAHRKFHSWDLFAEVWEVRWRGTFYPVADLGEGPGAPGPPGYFYTKLRPEGPKRFFWRPGIPLVSWSGWPPPPLIWISGSATAIT